MTDDNSESLFTSLVYSIHMTALQQLGAVVNPMTGKKERDLPQALISINMIDMLSAKTTGQLTQNESDFLNQSVAQLHQLYDMANA